MQTVWEVRILSSSFVTSIIICALIIAMCIILCVKTSSKHTILIRRICSIIVFVMVLFVANGISSTYTEWIYAQNNKSATEGIIENFVSGPNGAESFTINGVAFSYPSSNNLIGYNIPKRDRGSVITGEGQYVRLTYYCRSGENIIIKIETNVQKDYQAEKACAYDEVAFTVY